MAVLIQGFGAEHRTGFAAPLVQDVLVLFDVLARFQCHFTVVVIGGPDALEAEIGGETGPAVAHAGGGRLVCDVEELAAAALFRVQGGPDGEFGDHVGGGVVEEAVVAGCGAGERDFGAFSFDESV